MIFSLGLYQKTVNGAKPTMPSFSWDSNFGNEVSIGYITSEYF